MSDKSDDLSDISSLIDKDASGHELARFLMAKSRGLKIDRLFGGKERRISVQVELTQPTNKEQEDAGRENNVQSKNSENIAKAAEPVPPQQSTSPLRAKNATETLPNKPTIIADVVLNAHRSPSRVIPRTPEALPGQALPQTPKSSQLRTRVSSSDRLRRLSFRHLLGAGARRVLLNELNGTEDSSQFSQFEPGLQNHPECTSTPATNVHVPRNLRPKTTESLQNIAAALNHTNREYSIQKGPVEGQIILTPSHLTHQNTNRTQLNQTFGKCEEQIKEVTIRNVNVTYTPHARAPIDHNAIETILTDDESESSENDCQDSEAATISQQRNLASVAQGKTTRDATFVRPRTPIHKNSTQTIAIAQMDTEPVAVSSSNTCEAFARAGVKDNAVDQTSAKLPLVIKTRIQTEVFDDSDNLDEVSFTSNTTEDTTNTRRRMMRRKCTPPYIKDYKNATKKFKTKGKRIYLDKSKRSLYSQQAEECFEKSASPLTCEVTSTNIVATPVHCSNVERKRQTRSSCRSYTASRSPTSQATQKNSTAQRISQKCAEENAQSEDTQSSQRRSRSRSKKETSKKPNTRRRNDSSSSFHEHSPNSKRQRTLAQTPERCSNVERNKQTRPSRSPSLPLRQNTDQSPTSKRKRTLSQCSQRSSSSSSSRSTSRSPTLIYRRASPQQSSDESSTTEQTIIQSTSKPQNEQNSPYTRRHSRRILTSAGDPEIVPQRTSVQKEPSRMSNSEKQNQLRESALSTALPNGNKQSKSQAPKSKKPSKKRESSPTTTSLKAAKSKEKTVSESDGAIRRSQRDRKPLKINPYAIEIYTRAYCPERFVKPKKKVNAEKAKKRKSDEGASKQTNLQPRVKLRRLNLNAGYPNESGNSNKGDTIEVAQDALVSWLQSTNASTAASSTINDTNNHQYDDHFLSRELLVCENYKDIEFRFYNDPLDNLSLGYVIFKPKSVKKMVALKHCGIKFVCINGRFKFKIMEKNSNNTKEYICTVGDAFKVGVGDKYGIENLHETESGQLMMMKLPSAYLQPDN